MDMKGVEEAILGRLQEKASDFESRVFPNTPSNARGLLAADGEYLLRYEGSRYSPARRSKSGALIQDRTCLWAVTSRNRDLSPAQSNPGIYSMLEAARVSLVKWTVPGVPDATVMSMVQDGFTEEVEGIWEYTQVFGFTFPEVTP